MGLDELVLQEKKSAEEKFARAGINFNDEVIIKHLLRYGLRSPDRWATKKILAEKVNPKDIEAGLKTVEKHLADLCRKLENLGVELKEDFSDVYEEKVYSIDPEDKKGILKYLSIFNWPKQEATVLFISDPGFGQLLHDKRSDKGLHYFLKFNGLLEKLDAAMVLGGVPWVPLKANKKTNQYLKILGKKVNGTQFPDEEDDSSKVDDPEYFQKHVKNKITTLTEAIESGTQSLETMLGKNFSGEVFYFFSQQDRKNQEDKAELLISNYGLHQKEREKIDEKINKLEEECAFQEARYRAAKNACDVLKELKQQVKAVKDEDMIKLKINDYVTSNKESLNAILNDSFEVHQKVVSKITKVKDTQELGDFVNVLLKERTDSKARFEKVKSELRDSFNKKTNLEKMLKGFNVYKALGHLPADSDQDSIHHHQAMQEYLKELSNLWKKWGGDTNNIHPEARTDLEVKGYLYRMEPQINLSSDGVGWDTIQKQIIHLRDDPTGTKIIPDAYVSGYDAGGLRVMPQMKRREAIEEGSYHYDKNVVLHLKLPTMQSEDWLEYCWRNKIRSPWDVVRKRKGLYASGIVVQRFTEDGLTELTFLSTKDLVKMGQRAKQYEELKEEFETTTSEDKKGVLRFKLEDLKNSFKIEPSHDGKVEKKIEITHVGDSHIGAPNFLGRTTNYEILKSVVNYTLEKRNPDVVVMSEIPHGNHNTGSFKSDKQDVGLLPTEIEKLGKLIEADTSISDKQKITLLRYFSLLNRLTQPISSASKQLLEIADSGLIELGEKIIDKGGIGVLVSGNHYNDGNNQSHDEAEMLALSFDRKYRKSGRLWILDGTGERDGRGQFSFDQLLTEHSKEKGHTLGKGYAAHSFKVVSDPILGIMKSTEKMGLEVSDVYGFHVHQTGFGFANGKSIHIQPGLQTTNKFVDVIGQSGGYRGSKDIEKSRNPQLKDYRKVIWAPQSYLEEKYLTEETWAHKKISEEYLPKVRGKK